MPEIKQFGPKKISRHGITYRSFYVHVIWLKWWTWPIEFRETSKTDEPWLVGKGVILHFWPTKFGIVIGKWTREPDDEDAHLLHAVNSVPKDKLKKHVYPCGDPNCGPCWWDALDEETLGRPS